MAKDPWLVPAPGQEMVFGDPAPLHRNYLPADLKADAPPGGFGACQGRLGPQRPGR